jgi:CheY-like chemotaxis protein
LLDIVMPKIDGGELATQIEADRELHDTPIIFLTALVTHGEAKSGLHIQGHPLVAKPISIPELIDAIENIFLRERSVSDRIRAWRNHDGENSSPRSSATSALRFS